jgi:hypothetical protein
MRVWHKGKQISRNWRENTAYKGTMWVIKKKSREGSNFARSNQETGINWDYPKRGEVNKTMNSILDAIYSEYKNNSHCKHCGEWNEFDDSICSECGRDT